MKVSESWLREWVNPALTLDEIGHKLTMAGCEVDAVEAVATDFTGIIVGQIISFEKHPDADRLNVCQVDKGDGETLQIVCGAPNVRAGMKAPLALIGAVLPMPDGKPLKIKKGKLRGVESHGMLCAKAELGMTEASSGLLDLPEDAPIGADIRDYLSLNDRVLELGITPNRGDCLSIAGVAREVGLLTGDKVEAPNFDTKAAILNETFPVKLSATEACPRYVGRVIRNVNVKAQTPLWMQEKLRRQGLRSISPLVDVTNFVLIELGHPMHAFDFDKLQGGIDVRFAQAGEKLQLLDEQEVDVTENTLVIADDSGAIALAGVMGGLSSSVTDDTQHVFLESAHFAPTAIAGRARQYGLQTDASYRYERGVPADLSVQAMERATQLIVDICGGEVSELVDTLADESVLERRTVSLRHARLERVLGVSFDKGEVTGILKRLDCEVTETEAGWSAKIPLCRFDVSIEEDLIEEVARVRGYESIPAAYTPLQPKPLLAGETAVTLKELRSPLLNSGYQEAVTFSFVDEKVEQLLAPSEERIQLANPISADLGTMRSSIWSGLLPAVAYNLNRQQSRVRLFEAGPTFQVVDGEIQQGNKLAGAVTGLCEPEQWSQAKRKVDFYDIKGDVEAILEKVSATQFHFVPVAHPALHPGQCAQIVTQDAVVGWVGAVHPRLEKQLNLGQTVFVFELDLTQLQNKSLPKYEAVSKFPAIRRDLALLADDSVLASALDQAIAKVAPKQVVSWNVFDVYAGEGLGEGKKSIALNLILQDASCTLEDAEVNNIVASVVSSIEQETGATLR